MSCAGCAAKVENKLKEKNGVKNAVVNIATHQAMVEYDEEAIDVSELIQTIENLGYSAYAHLDENMEDLWFKEQDKEKDRLKKQFIFALTCSMPFLAIMLGHIFDFPLPDFLSRAEWQIILATLVQFVAGFSFYRGAFYTLRSGGANMDVLVVLGTTTAYLYSLIAVFFMPGEPLYFEVSVMLITLILLGKYLEASAKARASEAVKKLMELTPKTANIIRNGMVEEVPYEQVRKGDILLIRPGERVPVDGEIIEGYSSLDESVFTGESLPVDKKVGDKVIGGSINKFGIIKVRALDVGKDSMLSRIIRMVGEAQASKAPIQRLADVGAGYFVPVVLGLALITFIMWYFLLDKGDLVHALMNMTAVLVIACPCAMGLATPVSVMVGSGRAANLGFLIRGGEYLEKAHKIDTVVLDKTGTITEGTPHLTDIFLDKFKNQPRYLNIFKQAEALSDHPVGLAVAKGINLPPDIESDISFQEFAVIPGHGIKARVDGEDIVIGNYRFMKKEGISAGSLEELIEGYEKEGKTAVIMAVENEVAAVAAVADKIKENAAEVVKRLKKMGIDVWMISGDNLATCLSVAEKAGIDKVMAEVLPEEKAYKIKSLIAEGRTVAMVGDGINDAPALVAADIGIAMGNGTDIAAETAGIILVGGDLAKLPLVIELSRATVKNIKQNLFWAFIYNIIGIPLAMAGFLNPIIAGGAMSLSSVSVVLNALRLKKVRLK
ncbi:MAG: cadmium-translocating P-type ATPase [Thermosyntropha sp.]|nr:cadmium-translocating P-type ATPase [Thermosyntropha sp.]